MFKFKLLAYCIFCSFALPGQGGAETVSAFPFHGYFSQQSEISEPGFKQARCAFAFFQQNEDGSVVDYVLDDPLFKKSGVVKYRRVQTGECKFDPLTKTDECAITSPGAPAGLPNTISEYYENISADDVTLIAFPSKEAAKIFSGRIQRLIGPNPVRVSKNYFHRCEGFDENTLSDKLTNMTTHDPQSLKYFVLGRAVSKTDIPQILRVMEEIGPKALNATLPGQ